MSWSVSKIVGVPAAVRASANSAFDTAARSYQPAARGDAGEKQAAAELADIEAARATVNTAIDQLPANYNGVSVEASGSRGWSASLKVDVQPLQLALDVPSVAAAPVPAADAK